MSDEPEVEYQSALEALADSYKDGIRAFAKYVEKHWTMTPEEWRKSTNDDCPSDEWFDGRNDGIRSIVDAAEHFLGDWHP